MTSQLHAALDRGLRALAIAGADIALFCDRTEHAEPADVFAISACGAALRTVAQDLATALEIDLQAAYAARLREVEQRGANHLASEFDGAAAAIDAVTWVDLQRVQTAHDRQYHPDVVGMSRLDQVRHCVFHTAKLSGSLARALHDRAALSDLRRRRVADMLLFGLKLPFLARETLPDAPACLPGAVTSADQKS